MKYWHIFKMSVTRILTYRIDFVMGRLQNIAILLLIYFIWSAASRDGGRFAWLTANELITYVFVIHLLRVAVIGQLSARIAEEINDGTFSMFLLKPIKHFLFCYIRELGERSILFVSAAVEITVVAWLSPHSIVFPTYSLTWIPIVFFLITAHILSFLMSYALNLLAFWSHEAIGPRFLFQWVMEFASGAYFPLFIAGGTIETILLFLPFAYLIYVPVMIFLEQADWSAPLVLMIVSFWLSLVSVVTYLMWHRGLRRYSGQGI
ncbi:MAG TPA: ABC-2 family transporter protein [Patescibacteria group bacterium]|nr:ABC-2 family transporter protein [Patescibacteria group bacterium]